ncbi:MAG: zinc-binding alcohol dehydrogenase family protein [Bacteroidota bacterium]
MKAAVTIQTGDPSVIQVQEVPKPKSKPGWVLIQVKAFGLNRSEMYTRQGHSPSVQFPRIQGIECVGLVEEDQTGTYEKGQQVAAIMGEMGRAYDGGYAEYVLVPLEIVFAFKSSITWSTLGDIPEMFQTVSGSVNEALEVQRDETFLIRGGTSSIGMLSCQLAKTMGVIVISTTRKEARTQALLDNGADHVIIDDGHIADSVRALFPGGVNKVLELVGTKTLKDSLQCVAPRGVVCMTGILGNSWSMDDFSPMYDIPSTAKLTCYAGDAENLSAERLQGFIDEVAKGSISLNIHSVMALEDVPKAHEMMENSQAQGKMVVEL